jgi:hypothetical protein
MAFPSRPETRHERCLHAQENLGMLLQYNENTRDSGVHLEDSGTKLPERSGTTFEACSLYEMSHVLDLLHDPSDACRCHAGLLQLLQINISHYSPRLVLEFYT